MNTDYYMTSKAEVIIHLYITAKHTFLQEIITVQG